MNILHSSPTLSKLIAMGTQETYAPRHRILLEGDKGDNLYIVLAGQVRAFNENVDGNRFIIGTFGPGTMFGEGAIDGGVRSATIESLTETHCAKVFYQDILKAIQEDSTFALMLIKELVARSRMSAQRMKSLALETVYERLKVLLEMECTIRDGLRLANHDLTQQEIADRIGASRDMVTRIFRDLVKGGYLKTGRQYIELLKPLPQNW